MKGYCADEGEEYIYDIEGTLKEGKNGPAYDTGTMTLQLKKYNDYFDFF